MAITKFNATDDVVWEVTTILYTGMTVEGIEITMNDLVDAAVKGVDSVNKPPQTLTPYDMATILTRAAEALTVVATARMRAAGMRVR